MKHEFPGAVPEIPVSDVDLAAAYYKNHLGSSIDWGGEDGGIVSRKEAGSRKLVNGLGKMSKLRNEIYPVKLSDVRLILNESEQTVDITICLKPKRL